MMKHLPVSACQTLLEPEASVEICHPPAPPKGAGIAVQVSGRVQWAWKMVPGAFGIGVGVFALSSLACGLAVDGTTLIAARIGQAFGAVLMQPASSAIAMSTAVPGTEGRTMGIYVGVSMLGLLIGPLLGGVLTEHFGWPAIFYVNLPIAAAALGLVSPRE